MKQCIYIIDHPFGGSSYDGCALIATPHPAQNCLKSLNIQFMLTHYDTQPNVNTHTNKIAIESAIVC